MGRVGGIPYKVTFCHTVNLYLGLGLGDLRYSDWHGLLPRDRVEWQSKLSRRSRGNRKRVNEGGKFAGMMVVGVT